MSTDNQTVSNLQTQYNDTLKEYNGLLAKLTGSTTGYINRTNPNNSYLTDNPEPNTQNQVLCCNAEKKALRRVMSESTILKKNYLKIIS